MNSRAQNVVARTVVAAVLGGAMGCMGCDSQQGASSRALAQEPPPVGTTQTAHEDDVIAPLYKHDEAASSAAANTRTSTPPPGTIKTPAAPKAAGDPSAETTGARAERTTDAAENPERAASTDPERRTSMPQRRGSTGATVKGGVRKALSVAQAASPLFGRWTVDTERSSKGFVNADSILFLADGRMRVWRGGAPEDGRWTWDSREGIKTGGVERLPFTLGVFDLEAGEVIVTRSGDGEIQTLVLRPDRLFVAPPAATQTGPPTAPNR